MSAAPSSESGQLARAFADFATYRRHLKIQDRLSHRRVAYEPNQVQARIGRAIVEAERDGRPFRGIGYKSRRMGMSTAIQMRFAHRGFTRENVLSYTVAHDVDTAGLIFGMTERAWKELPDALRPERDRYVSGRKLILETGSEFRIETAADADAGRAAGAFNAHLSELAFWPIATAHLTLLAILQVVPASVGTIVFIESTANGVGNTFHTEWLRAASGESDFQPFFFSWLEDPVYRMDARDVRVALLDEEERWLYELAQREHRLSSDEARQALAWRRWMLRNQIPNGSLELFHQEYPATPEQGFISSGFTYFDPDLLRHFAAHVQEPRYRGQIVGLPKKGEKLEFRKDDRPDAPYVVWEPPRRDGRRYVVHLDPAGGISPNEAVLLPIGENRRKDWSVAYVVDCVTQAIVARYRTKRDADVAARDVAKLGLLYAQGGATIFSAETTGGWGWPAIVIWRDMGLPIYRDRNRKTYRRDTTEQYGWKTNDTTRPLILDGLTEVIRDHVEHVRDATMLSEMHTFLQGRRRPDHAPGTHDDCILAAAAAFEIARMHAQRDPSLQPKRRNPPVLSVAARASIAGR